MGVPAIWERDSTSPERRGRTCGICTSVHVHRPLSFADHVPLWESLAACHPCSPPGDRPRTFVGARRPRGLGDCRSPRLGRLIGRRGTRVDRAQPAATTSHQAPQTAFSISHNNPALGAFMGVGC